LNVAVYSVKVIPLDPPMPEKMHFILKSVEYADDVTIFKVEEEVVNVFELPGFVEHVDSIVKNDELYKKALVAILYKFVYPDDA
jgi:hypothetical protein